MYINRALLLLVAAAFVIFPVLQEWILSGGSHWYRPWIIWLLFVAAAYWNQRARQMDDL